MSGLLDHSPSDVLRYALVDLGCGTLPESESSWPIFVSSEPSLPDQVVTIYDPAGRYDGRSMRTGLKFEYHGVQIRIRGINHQDAQLKANQIAITLDSLIRNLEVTIPSEGTGTGSENSHYILGMVSRNSGPISLGNERDTNRILFTINAVLTLRQIT